MTAFAHYETLLDRKKTHYFTERLPAIPPGARLLLDFAVEAETAEAA